MKARIYIFLIGITVLAGCQNEESAPVGVGDTYMKFIGSDVNNTAVTALENEDGSFVLLANASQNAEEEPEKWIKLIKTDRGGNVINTISYPDTILDEYTPYIASSMIPYNSGYLIVGQRIHGDTSSILLIKVTEGEDPQEMIIDAKTVAQFQKSANDTGYSLIGKALFQDEASNLFLLAEKNYPSGASTNYALIAQLNPDDLSLMEVNDILGAAISSFTNNLSKQQDETLLFGSHYSDVNGTGTYRIRLIQAAINDGNTVNPIEPYTGDLGNHAFINHISHYKNPEKILAIGETSSEPDPDEEAPSDRVLVFYDYPGANENVFQVDINDPNTLGTDAATGYVGLINNEENILIAGAVGNEEGERRLFIQKIDALKNTLWDNGRVYGGNGERPAALLQTKDGGYFILSTTHFGNIASLLLIKTDANGNL